MRLTQSVTMAAIVATLLWLPVGALLGLLAYLVLGVAPEGFVTFGGTLNQPAGVLAWWALAFAASLVYAWFAMPEG